MKVKNTLLSALPIFLILTALTGAIIFFPDSKDIRNRAADPAIFNAPTTIPTPSTVEPTTTFTPTYVADPNTACADLYRPVCGSDNVTYESACEATKAGVNIAYSTSCVIIKDPPNTYVPPVNN